MAAERPTFVKAAGGPVGYARSLRDLLRELREAAGSPSLTTLAGRVPPASGEATSKGYLSEIFSGSRTPSGARAEAIAKALQADENMQKRARWLAEQAAADSASPRMMVSQGDGSPGWWARSGYIEVVRGLVPVGGLRDRAAELAELASFCDDDDPYLWWQADPWAGKTALLATFVLDPPARCDVVSFFVTASLTVQADATACTEALLDQLSALTGEQLPAALIGSTRDGHRRKLLRLAAERAHGRGRRLVLVLDGLDEDCGTSPGSGLSSVAALLPAATVAGLRVVVASRPSPALPDDVPQDHPLRSCGVRQLVASPYAGDLGRRARQELHEQLSAGAVGQEVLGFITASQGGLTVADLSELAGRAPFEPESTLAGALGRTIGVRNGRYAGSLVFAHETLAVEAVERFGAALRPYRERLHQWAASYRERGWPPETPHYLLQGYARMVAAVCDDARVVDVVTDAVRHDRLQDLTGGDAAALAELRAAEEVVSGADEDGLLRVVRLAARRHELASCNEELPIELPAVWVALGQPDRAESLARGISDPLMRASALTSLVSALIKSGDQDRAERLAFGLDVPFRRMEALTQLAEAAVERGGLADAARLVTAALSDADELRVEHRASLLAGIAAVQVAIGDRETAISLVEAAVTAAEEVVGWEDASHADVTDVAAVLIRLGDAGRAERMVRDLVPQPEVPLGYAALAVAAQGFGEDALARRFIALGAGAADLLTDGYQRGTALVALARACIAAGDPDQARTLLDEGIKAENPIDYGAEEHDLLMLELTSLAGQLGAMAEAEEIAGHIVSDSYESARAEVARAWGAAGRLDLAERIVDEELRRPYVCAAVLAGLAASAVTGAPADAERLALRAQSVARASPYRRRRLLDALAASVAAIGDKDLAAAIVRRIDSPAKQVAAMTGMVAAMVKVGGWAYARETATAAESALGGVTDAFDYGEQAVALVTVIVGAGDHDRAARLASAIREPVWQVDAICAIAAVSGRGPEALAQAQQAEEIAARTHRREEYDWALVEVAAAYAHASEDGEAQAVADRIKNDIIRDRARFQIAKAAVVAGEYAAAEAIIATIADEYVRDDAVAMTAEHQADGRDLESAVTLLSQLSDPGCRARAITAIAVGAAANGDWATAERYLTDLDNKHQTTRHLAGLALTAAKASEPSRARRYLLQALPDGDLETLLPAIAATEPSTILYLARQVVEAEPDALGPR